MRGDKTSAERDRTEEVVLTVVAVEASVADQATKLGKMALIAVLVADWMTGWGGWVLVDVVVVVAFVVPARIVPKAVQVD